MTATLDNDFEVARRQLVINAIDNLKNTIVMCYGEGEYPASNFSDKQVSEVFYNSNELAVRLYSEIEDINESR